MGIFQRIETAIVVGLAFAVEAAEPQVCHLSQPGMAERSVGRRGMEATSHCALGSLYGLEDVTAPFWALGFLTTQERVGSWYLRVPNFG